MRHALGAFKDLTGHESGRLRVLRQAGYYVQKNGTKGSLWECLCDPKLGGCGGTIKVRVGKINNGHTKSCGCLQAEQRGSGSITHGATRSKVLGIRQRSEYTAWQEIKKRCTNQKNARFHRYGARGIDLCARWQDSSTFLADMGPKPTQEHTIDRRDNDKGYWCGKHECSECGPLGREPNCRWATQQEQQRNRTNNRVIEFRGERWCLAEWAEVMGMKASALSHRLGKLPVEQAFAVASNG